MDITLLKGDITQVKTDAIVNCTSVKLVIGGGSLDTAIHRKAGPGLMEECRRIITEKKNIAIGECLLTDSYKLPCKKVIHTACPVYMGGGWNEAEHLAECYRSALTLADRAFCESIAFPALGTGAHTYPKRDAAALALTAVRALLPTLACLKQVVFVCLDDENYRIYQELLSV